LVIAESGLALIIEAKSRRKPSNKFTKKLHGQVLSHENWFNANYSAQQQRRRVVVSATVEAETNAGTQGTGVLTFDALAALISDTRSLLKAALTLSPDECSQGVTNVVVDLKLTMNDIVNRLTNFTDAKDGAE
jgi:hypothetical protein